MADSENEKISSKRPSLIKRATWLAGMLLLGGLGSGFWDIALKPIFMWVGTQLLDLATLGISSLQDSLYADIARGADDRESRFLFIFLLAVVFIMPILSGMMIWRVTRSSSRNRRPGQRRPPWKALSCMTVASVILLIQGNSQIYATRAVSHIAQLERIVVNRPGFPGGPLV